MSTSQCYREIRAGRLGPPIQLIPNGKAVGLTDEQITEYLNACRARPRRGEPEELRRAREKRARKRDGGEE